MKISLQDLLAELPKPVLNHIHHLERMRQDFVANVSHELRTPITVLHGYLESLLQSGNVEPHLEKIYRQMYQQTFRMHNLVSDLLLLSGLEAPEHEPGQEKPIHFAELLEQVAEEVKQLSLAKKQEITLTCDKALHILGQENELHSLSANLIINAIKYTPEYGHIKIYWFKDKGKAIFAVEDNGIGIEKKHIPRLTERFYRVDNGRSRESGGTGLGLAIVKHVLIRHHGQLKIQSELNKGSVFRCIFPAKQVAN